jgi:hypothetical protein
MRHRETDTDFDAVMAVEKRENRWVRLSPNLDTGAILQILALVFIGGVGWSKIENNKELADQRDAALEKRVSEQEKRTDTTLADLKNDVKQTGQQVNDLKNKIDLIDLKLSQRK